MEKKKKKWGPCPPIQNGPPAPGKPRGPQGNAAPCLNAPFAKIGPPKNLMPPSGRGCGQTIRPRRLFDGIHDPRPDLGPPQQNPPPIRVVQIGVGGPRPIPTKRHPPINQTHAWPRPANGPATNLDRAKAPATADASHAASGHAGVNTDHLDHRFPPKACETHQPPDSVLQQPQAAQDHPLHAVAAPEQLGFFSRVSIAGSLPRNPDQQLSIRRAFHQADRLSIAPAQAK